MSPRITLVATLKNEGPYILEWVAYHKMIGFTDFVLFSNDCTDGTNLILNRLDRMGVVTHYDNPLGPRMDPQRAAYSSANRLPQVRESDWVMVLDADEFLSVTTGDGSVLPVATRSARPARCRLAGQVWIENRPCPRPMQRLVVRRNPPDDRPAA